GGVEDGPALPGQGLATFLHRGGAGGEGEVAGDAGLVVVDDQPGAAHGLEDLELEGADGELGGLLGHAPGGVEGVLLAVPHDREGAVEDAQVRVSGHGDPEVVLTVPGVPVEPVAVVDVPVGAPGMSD